MNVVILTQFLAPFLPFLMNVGNKAAESAAEKFGENAWEKAKAIWDKLASKIEARESAKEAATDLSAAPDDKGLQTMLQVQLKKLLENDEKLTSELVQLMQEEPETAATISKFSQQGKSSQNAGDNAIQIGQIGSAGTINFRN